MNIVSGRIVSGSVADVDADKAEPSGRRVRGRDVDLRGIDAKNGFALNFAGAERLSVVFAHARQGVDETGGVFKRSGATLPVRVAGFSAEGFPLMGKKVNGDIFSLRQTG